ncbi:VOC family protein [Halobacterium litoreum]|uniref:VOC family protein n=1 Tax=Halobacterium litoreum TaxID=2039234 RepID=A0ABD5NGW6_9EURY|nr:VOC family protein [Halobacterium litoreum]UHH12904.1 VOC family protein [Halobacterium litoreum]
MFTRIHHVAFLVGDLDEASAAFESQFGVEQLTRREMTGDFELAVALYPVGESLVELITPTTDSGWVYETWREQGDGFFHIAFEVDDVHERMAELQAAGVAFDSDAPQEGLDWLVATLDADASVVPMQLVEDEKTMDERIAAFRTSEGRTS